MSDPHHKGRCRLLKRTVHWPGAGIYTVTGLRNANRRLDRRRAGVGRVLGEMKRGASLHLQHANGRALWSLSTGVFITSEVAALIIARPEVVAVGDGLFRNVPGQTWRYAEEDHHGR
jgi:hypothetical protein